MSARPAAPVVPLDVASDPRRVAILRAVAALVWAAALAVAASGDDVGPDLTAGLAALVAAYPIIDVVASLAGAARDRSRLTRVNALVSTVAVAALAVAAFGSDVGAVLAVFGAWAVVSGVLQLAVAVHRRRAGAGREIPMIVSGALSALAGLSFVAASGADDPSLTSLAGYAAGGAVLFLAWALRNQSSALKS